MPVDQVSDLVDVGRGETIGVGLVVSQLGVDVVMDVPLFGMSQSDNDLRRGGKTRNVLQGGGTTEGEALKSLSSVKRRRPSS